MFWFYFFITSYDEEVISHNQLTLSSQNFSDCIQGQLEKAEGGDFLQNKKYNLFL